MGSGIRRAFIPPLPSFNSYNRTLSFKFLGTARVFEKVLVPGVCRMLPTKPEQPLSLLNDVSIDEAIAPWISGDRERVVCTHLDDSSWSWPMQVSLMQGDSITKRYFIKISKSELGMSMLRGEYESMTLLHSIAPNSAVRPVAWGACSSQPAHYFYISSFHDLIDEPPNVRAFCAMTAHFHNKSAELFERGHVRPEPGGRFGFHITTHMGKFPQDNTWTDSWEEFFIRGMRRILAYETDAQGRLEALDTLTSDLLEKVIPRLLRPLETGGRSVRPVLIHGDLQIRNVKTEKETLRPLVFDAGSFWGHNECELGKWRPKRFAIGPQYMGEYHKLVPKADPVDDWEDRNILYSIRFDLLSSAHYPGNPTPRGLALDNIRYLINKHPNGYDSSIKA